MVGFEFLVVTFLAVLQIVRDGLLQVASAPATNSQLRRSGQDNLGLSKLKHTVAWQHLFKIKIVGE